MKKELEAKGTSRNTTEGGKKGFTHWAIRRWQPRVCLAPFLLSWRPLRLPTAWWRSFSRGGADRRGGRFGVGWSGGGSV